MRPPAVDPRGAWAARGLLLVAAVALAVSLARPYWSMRVKAPQYPQGLTLVVYANRLEGDVRELDMLNHYIGMRPLEQGATTERTLAIPGILLAAAALLAAGWLSAKWAALLALPAALIAPIFAVDLFLWLRHFGLHLDPKAPLSSAIKPFVPTLLGHGRIAQFDVIAWFGPGFWLAAAAGVIALAALWRRPRSPRRQEPGAAARAPAVALAAAVIWIGLAGPASANTLVVGPGGFTAVQEAVNQAAEGDTIVVRAGRYAGPLEVRARLTLVGDDGAILDGGGRGTVVTLAAPGIVMRGFTVRGSGDLLSAEDTGILASAPDIVIEGNHLEDVLFGISLRRADRGVVRGNGLRGKPLAVARRGDAIRVWSSDDVTMARNRVLGGRDVVFWYSKRLAIRGNEIRRGRYGLHFMYCDGAEVADNLVADNSVGIYLMYSAHLALRGNRMVGNRGPSGYGLGLKDMDGVRIEGNVLADNRVGVFLEHASGAWVRNRIVANDTGIWLWPSSQRNRFEGNDLIDNGEQVTVQGELGDRGNAWAGNFWSDYRGFDADGDGTGDIPYRALHLFERLASRYPALRWYATSPAARTIEFAARLFPVFAPRPNLVDRQPRMRPHPVAAAPSGSDGGVA
ncbi:MAG: nitrous oxide reductase family maturation protein NosD [Candidatus Omnitrophica bacterium]|nr:nitrous oxide reductase family maturation protein NosD [Candidatus Omnitrophota bacterium]